LTVGKKGGEKGGYGVSLPGQFENIPTLATGWRGREKGGKKEKPRSFFKTTVKKFQFTIAYGIGEGKKKKKKEKKGGKKKLPAFQEIVVGVQKKRGRGKRGKRKGGVPTLAAGKEEKTQFLPCLRGREKNRHFS